MKSISLFVLFWASINIHAVDNLRIPDIRSLGMGGNGVTQSVLFNPALVALNTDKVLHLEYFNRYGVKELGTVGIGFVYPNPSLSAGVDISSFGYDQYRETLFRLSVGKQLNGRWRIGIGFQYKTCSCGQFRRICLRTNIRWYRPSCWRKYRNNFPQISESCLVPLTNC